MILTLVSSLAPGNNKLPREAKKHPLFTFSLLSTSPAPRWAVDQDYGAPPTPCCDPNVGGLGVADTCQRCHPRLWWAGVSIFP